MATAVQSKMGPFRNPGVIRLLLILGNIKIKVQLLYFAIWEAQHLPSERRWDFDFFLQQWQGAPHSLPLPWTWRNDGLRGVEEAFFVPLKRVPQPLVRPSGSNLPNGPAGCRHHIMSPNIYKYIYIYVAYIRGPPNIRTVVNLINSLVTVSKPVDFWGYAL